MTEASFIKPPNRLASRVGKGMSRPTALARADENLDSIRDDILAYVDRNLTELDAIFAGCAGASDPALATLYDPSNTIAGTAGTIGLVPLGKAAYNLCELIAGGEMSGAYNLPAIKLHLDGMRLLRRFSSPEHDNDADLILQNLAKLITHVKS